MVRSRHRDRVRALAQPTGKEAEEDHPQPRQVAADDVTEAEQYGGENQPPAEARAEELEASPKY
jgi:hypothetical protein